MNRQARGFHLLATFVLVCSCGCSTTNEPTYPEDPLFVRKEPIETPAVNLPPKPLPVVKPPQPPPVPPPVLVASRKLIVRQQKSQIPPQLPQTLPGSCSQVAALPVRLPQNRSFNK